MTSGYTQTKAQLSECQQYRYWLTREWCESPTSRLVWVMLNPSTADANVDDPTIRRVVGFSKREEAHAAMVLNVWALRATDPKDLHARRGAFEPENLEYIERLVDGQKVVVAWGSSVAVGPGLSKVRQILQRKAASVWCLGYTKGHGPKRLGRQPRHPLYLRADTPLEPFDWGL
jgi:hypothetical protein